MCGISRQVEPPLAQSRRDAMLHPIPRRPDEIGNSRVETCIVQERLQLRGGHWWTRLPEWELVLTRRLCCQQPPRGALTKRKDKHKPAPPGHYVGGLASKGSVEFKVGQHH